MKRFLCCFIFSSLVLTSLEAEVRVWKDASGEREIRGELLGYADGKVRLKREDGKVMVFKIDVLSGVDQRYIKSLAESGGLSQGVSWLQWRGADRADHSPDTGLLEKWPKDGPKQLWVYKEAGSGYSGFSVAGGKLFTIGVRDAEEVAICLDALTGEEKWKTTIGSRYSNRWGNGPRSTPTIDGEFVFCQGARGDIACLKRSDGSLVWKKSLIDDLGGSTPVWGYTESPLVDGLRVICTPGGDKGAMAALDRDTGETLWRSEEFTDGAQYSSAILVNHGGTRQYVQLFMKALIGVAADSGKVLWKAPWEGKTAVIPTPIYHDGAVYITSGYKIGCKLVKLGGANPEEIYRNDVMVNHHGGVVRVGKYLYGYSDKKGWTCQEWATGKALWTENEELRKGAIHFADGKLYCLEEDTGIVALIDASPRGWKERGRLTLDPQSENRKASGKIWTHPVVVGGKLYLRDQEFVYCYDVKAE